MTRISCLNRFNSSKIKYYIFKDKTNEILENIDKYNQSEKAIVVMNNNQKQMKKNVKDLSSTIQHDMDEIESIKSSKEYTNFSKVQENIGNLNEFCTVICSVEQFF